MIYKSECGVYKIEKSWNVIRFYKNNELHTDDDKPAVEYFDGTKEYYKNGKLHRDGDLPAIEWSDGTVEYWKEGIRYNPNEIILQKGDKIEIVYQGEIKTFEKGQVVNLTCSL